MGHIVEQVSQSYIGKGKLKKKKKEPLKGHSPFFICAIENKGKKKGPTGRKKEVDGRGRGKRKKRKEEKKQVEEGKLNGKRENKKKMKKGEMTCHRQAPTHD